MGRVGLHHVRGGPAAAPSSRDTYRVVMKNISCVFITGGLLPTFGGGGERFVQPVSCARPNDATHFPGASQGRADNRHP